MLRRRFVGLSTVALTLALIGGTLLAVPVVAAAGGATGGSFALSGQAAREFRLPADVVEVRSWTDATGRATTRYQQMVDRASVFGVESELPIHTPTTNAGALGSSGGARKP